ncbi:MAG: hypothetical protein ACI4MN_00795 [Candidatus Coproplasma sp.]
MKFYFLTEQRAALKLNGELLGILDSIERYVEIPDGEEVLAEIIPVNCFLPYNVLIGRSLLKNPPPFLNVYLFGDGVQIHITHYERPASALNILEQRRMGGLNVTLFQLCGLTYLSCDGKQCSLYRLPDYFVNCRLSEESIGGTPVVLAAADNGLCVISAEGKKLYLDRVESYSTGDMLGVTVNFKSSAGYFAEREYAYDGQNLQLNREEIKRRYAVDDAVSHFAFFEGVLYGADCKEFLSEDMQGATEAIKEYLGEFKEVCVPHKAFYDKYGDICAAALAYRIKDNLFEIKYFAVEYKDGKIDNIKAMP